MGSQILCGRPHNICDPTSSNHHNSEMLHLKIIKTTISQLLVLASKKKLGSVDHGVLE